MKQLEEWSFSEFEELIFDSTASSDSTNSQKYSMIVEQVKNKHHLLFLIETDDGIKCGGYVQSEITGVEKWIEDPHAFVFTFREGTGEKFDILNKSEAFKLKSKKKS